MTSPVPDFSDKILLLPSIMAIVMLFSVCKFIKIPPAHINKFIINKFIINKFIINNSTANKFDAYLFNYFFLYFKLI